MHLTTGARLGAYEIVSPLGAGGMGEVYRARDTRLDRTVALKILPARFAAREELRERFEREARVVSNLNHPNICALYDVGNHDDVAYLVMEYLEGQTLADKLSKGPLPQEQLLRYAIDIADALAKAHRHGIIHRDLKPGNIMITKSGAKLLDFGLARRARESAVMPDAPTVQRAGPLTTEGTIVGTLQYMSPEQLEGGELDARSDLFSLGAVLYEMATGRRAFEASSHASLITKIMSEQPRPVRELAPVTPPALEELITRCLQKDPEQRWQCAGDIAAELRALASGAKISEEIYTRRKRPILPWAIAALLLLIATTLAVLLVKRGGTSEELIRFTIPAPASGTGFSSLVAPLAVSPDGTHIAFAGGGGGIWLRTLSGTEAKPIAPAGISPFWSPDSASIGFFANGKLMAYDVASGATRTLCDVAPGGTPIGTWSPHGTIVFTDITGQPGIHLVSANGSAARKLYDVDRRTLAYHSPRFLPDGRRFLVNGIDGISPSLWVGSTEPNVPIRRIAGDTPQLHIVGDHAVFVSDGTLVAQRFDDETLQRSGPLVPLSNSVQSYWTLGAAALSVSPRTIVAMPWGNFARLQWLGRDGADRGSGGPEGEYRNVRLSPDGKTVLVATVERKTGLGELWTIDALRKTLTRFTFDRIDHEHPVWSPDGRRVVFASDVNGPPHLFLQNIGDPQPAELLPVSNRQEPREWIGDRIFYTESFPATRNDILYVSPSGRKPAVWLRTPYNESGLTVSPDGKWAVYMSDASGTAEAYAAPLDRPREAIRLTTSGARLPRWSADGREVYFISGHDVFAVPVLVNAHSLTPGDPERLFTTRGEIVDYDVARDGRLLFAFRDDATAQMPLDVILNWQAALKK